MVKKEAKKQEVVSEEPNADEMETDGEELFDGLDSVSAD